MANTVGARVSCVIFEANSKPKMLQKEYRTAILHCYMRRFPRENFATYLTIELACCRSVEV